MLNNCTFMGRMVRDPELRHTPDGVPVTTFTLAVDRDGAPKNGGERQTDFIDFVAWRNTAEYISKYMTKGRMIAAIGSLQIRNWTDKDGNKRRNAEIIVSSAYFADSKREPAAQGNPYINYPTNPPAAQNPTMSQPDYPEYTEVYGDDDLPF